MLYCHFERLPCRQTGSREAASHENYYLILEPLNCKIGLAKQVQGDRKKNY